MCVSSWIRRRCTIAYASQTLSSFSGMSALSNQYSAKDPLILMDAIRLSEITYIGRPSRATDCNSIEGLPVRLPRTLLLHLF